MKKQLIILLAMNLLIICGLFAQVNITGIVVDAKSNEALPFANVVTSEGEGGITNEKGKFLIELEEAQTELIVSYVGYHTQRITINADKLFYPVKLIPSTIELSSIEILANDERAADLFYKAIERSRKLSLPFKKSKVFRRTYSTINKGAPTELLEAYYNATLTEGGVRSFELKNGRIGVPVDNYILQLDLCKILERYNFYGDAANYFPSTPLRERSRKKLQKNYYVRFKGSFVMERDTVVEVSFESKQKGKAFYGVAFIKKSSNTIIRVVHQIDQADHVPFQTILNKEGTSVENMSLKWDTGFKEIDGAPVPNYMQVVLTFDYLNKKRKSPLKTNTKLFFYDYDGLFEMPIYGEEEVLNDYDKIMATPYNPVFWDRTHQLAETAMEERFRRELEARRLFVNDDPENNVIELLNQEFQLIEDDMQPNWGRVSPSKGGAYDPLTGSNLGTDNYNCLYAKTFLAVDYNCFADTTQFKAQAVLNYNESYMCNRNESEARFFIKFLEYAALHAKELEKDLAKKYANKCPKKEELRQIVWKAEKAMRKELFAKFNGRNKRDAAHLEFLNNALGIREKQL